MKLHTAIALSVGLAVVCTAVATPPLQVVSDPVRIDPIAVAPAWIENGHVVIGEWQEYTGVTTRSRKGMYYAFDSVGGYTGYPATVANYVNNAHGGLGADPGETRFPGSTGCSDQRYIRPDDADPTIAEDIQTEACGSSGGFPIDGIDFMWWWGAASSTSAPCVISFFTSDESSACDNGDPLTHEYLSGVALNYGTLVRGGYYYSNVSGLNTQYHIFVQMPAPGGSYLGKLTYDGSTPATGASTQFALWGTGDGSNEPYRAGTQGADSWNDVTTPYGTFQDPGECSSYTFGFCPDPLANNVGFLALRCPADVNWDGFVNGDDFDMFAENYDAGVRCADVNGDGFVNDDDFDAFASWFDAGC